jgi:hypothetical protein
MWVEVVPGARWRSDDGSGFLVRRQRVLIEAHQDPDGTVTLHRYRYDPAAAALNPMGNTATGGPLDDCVHVDTQPAPDLRSAPQAPADQTTIWQRLDTVAARQ